MGQAEYYVTFSCKAPRLYFVGVQVTSIATEYSADSLPPEQPPVLADIKRGLPVAASLPDQRSSPEDGHHQQGKDDPRHSIPPGDAHGERLVEAAVADTAPAADAFRRENALPVHDVDVGRADLAADPAGDAALGSAGDAHQPAQVGELSIGRYGD